MGFSVEQECPQCGAPIELDEADHLLHCPYCDVNSFLFTNNYFRYVLPEKASDRDTIYAPYLRFKGAAYFCKGLKIGHRIVDITHTGLKLNNIPVSLGLRPQAMKMKFITPDIKGSFLRFSLKASDILARAGKFSSGTSSEKILHKAFIGETMSLIYLPLYLEGGRLFDGVLNRPIATLTREGRENLESAIIKNPRWRIRFIPTLCPECGWNLEGERDSVVLACHNCHTAWEAQEGKFARVNLSVVPGQDGNSVYLPFWKIYARTKGVKIDSFSDFIRLTNQPRVIDDELKEEDMSFWSPAFKIRPKLFLNLSRQFTISQKRFLEEEAMPEKNIYPVTLPLSEAFQALKIILAGSSVNKKNVFPYLPGISFEIKNSKLVYLPFTETAHDMIQQDMGISVNKRSLEFGSKL
ncbi:hypothetical protein OAC89_06940 [Deltaproteobacteria bacterium]|nr:hypothetical protein [Deltaproteobacteria bacterium]